MTARTWDGLEIATDQPTGSTVVVRRPGLAEPEFLLLHRSVNGPDFEGDWAWTPPAGARQPGEAVYPAARRELAEEAGLTGVHPWVVDASPAADGRQWAVFAVDVSPETPVELVDPEHDRYEWVTADQAAARILPAFVAANTIGRLRRTRPAEVTFRPMTHADLPQVRDWRLAPHAAPWWAPTGECDLDDLARRYGPRIDCRDPVRMWVTRVDGRDVGYVQDYPVASDDEYAAKTGDPDAVAFDYLLGDPALIGRGLGTRIVWEYLRDVVRPAYPSAPRLLASPDHRNKPSLRMLAKCGFTQGRWIDVPSRPGAEVATEIVCSLDVTHWFGPAG